SAPAGPLWNEQRPLMFLWLPNTDSGQEVASWPAAGSSVGGLIRVTGDGGRNEDCTNCAPLRECAATLLWRNGAGRFIFDRGADQAGSSSNTFRERGFHHMRRTG